ncbi:MAG: OmpA family protein [Chthoniobacteraceae bacterium]
MDHYDTFRATAVEAPIIRRWLFVALILSLGIHAALIIWFYKKQLQNFGPAEVPALAPPSFVVKQVYIDPQSFDQPQEKPEPKKDTPIAAIENIVVPEDKPTVSEATDIRVAPQVPALSKQLLNEKPKVTASGVDNLDAMNALSKGNMDKELNSLAGALLKESPRVSPRQPILAGGSRVGDGGIGSAAGIPGLKSLDEALAQTGPLPAGDAPIGMPGGALFEYDSYDLRPESLTELRKLGDLIQRNPNATFSIEGHTDSFGSPEYNIALSEKRAESVKIWLVEMMQIAPDRIQTKGFGNTKPIVSSDKSKEDQAPNRRVEIVVKTGRR